MMVMECVRSRGALIMVNLLLTELNVTLLNYFLMCVVYIVCKKI